jgi:hypothetical protein
LTGLNFKVHEFVGVSTVVFVIIHFSLIVYKNNKLKRR